MKLTHKQGWDVCVITSPNGREFADVETLTGHPIRSDYKKPGTPGWYLTRRIWPRRKLTTWGLAFLAITGIGTILVGLAPENVNVPLHLLGALNIPCGNIALLLLGLANRKLRPGIGRLALVLSGVGFLGMLGGPALIALTGHGGGLAERLALYPAIVWTVLLGLSVLRVRKTDLRATTT